MKKNLSKELKKIRREYEMQSKKMKKSHDSKLFSKKCVQIWIRIIRNWEDGLEGTKDKEKNID